MVKEVIKRDGTKEPFDVEKIKKAIAITAKQVGLSEKRKDEIIEQVVTAVMAMKGKEIATSEIRKKILSNLDRIEPAVSAAWRKYNQKNKRI